MTIEWTTFDKAPETVNIELLQDFALHSSIAEGIDTSAHEYEWTVPENLDTSNNYAIRIGDGSCKFKIHDDFVIHLTNIEQTQTLLILTCLPSKAKVP
jgi:hypothetical protein